MNYDCTRAIIDLDAISANFDAILKKANAPVMAIVKADAYGHGAIPVARLLEGRCAFFGVSSMLEARELRCGGLKKPILILGYTPPEAYPDAIRLGVRPAIFRYADAVALSRAAQEAGACAPFHFAVDTGMSRIGFQVTQEQADVCAKIAALPGLYPEGLFSHFATADCADLSRARRQAERFAAFDDMLKARGVNIPIRHLNNSAGLMNFENRYEMVRSGIITYGLYPSDEVDPGLLPLTPAMSLVSRISHVKLLPPGREISYGGTFVTTRPTLVATVPVGYADGYRRNLSNRFYVLVRGKKAPILGRICMDQMMVDVTDIPDTNVGDTVTLIGRDADQTISMEEIAAAADSFNYEFACGISRRVPRVYVKDGKIVHTTRYLTDAFEEEPHGL
ncbi:MAG: alanine racemase [Firmicutes bacterium]|nr:alanine racemase [Bacillota bacterium]